MCLSSVHLQVLAQGSTGRRLLQGQYSSLYVLRMTDTSGDTQFQEGVLDPTLKKSLNTIVGDDFGLDYSVAHLLVSLDVKGF